MARYAITGGTGMIGREIASLLRSRGDEVVVLTRGAPRSPDELQWDPAKGVSAPGRLEGLQAVFNLTGAPIADRPWTKARRQVLWDSRVKATEVLLKSLRKLDRKPLAFVGVGHLGIYGDRGDEELDESAAPGAGFLAELAQSWEGIELEATRELGCRASVLRMGLVLSHTGGAFPLMIKPFSMGIGGWLGTGRQYTSWLSIRDSVGALVHLADTDGLSGPFNGTSPVATRNYDWCKVLAEVLGSAVMAHAPKWALRGALGELAEDVFLASIHAVPKKLVASGYTFKDADARDTFTWLVQEHHRLTGR